MLPFNREIKIPAAEERTIINYQNGNITGNLDYTDELCYDLLGDQNNENFLLQVFNEAWASNGGIHPRVSLKRSITS